MTSGASISRILTTRDGGNTWNAYDTPLVSSSSAGGLSVAFRDPWHGIVGGGDLADDTAIETATSDDGGRTWTLTSKPAVKGAIFCLAYLRGLPHEDDEAADDEQDGAAVITTETQPNFDSGFPAWSPDEGRTRFPIFDVSGYWAVAFTIGMRDGSSVTTDRS